MTQTSKSVKLFNIEERKTSTGQITEIDIFQWKNTILDNLKREPDFKDHCQPSSRWGVEKETNRGFEDDIHEDGVTAEQKADRVNSMLTRIASYAPKSIVREITKRSTKLEDIWDVTRDWAGIRTNGTKHLEYFKTRKSFQKIDKEESPQEFFYRLRDAMEDTLVLSENNLREYGKMINTDEEMTPTVNSIVVLDWLEAVGGPKLVEHIHRVYATDLESVTLASLQSKIWKNLPALLHEIEEAQETQVSHCEVHSKGRCQQVISYRSKNNRSDKSFMTKRTKNNNQSRSKQQTKFCKLCRASGSQSFRSHDISECWLINDVERNAIAKSAAKANAMFACDENQSSNSDTQYEESEEENNDNDD